MKKLQDFDNELFRLNKNELSSTKGAETGIRVNFSLLPIFGSGHEELKVSDNGERSKDFIRTDWCMELL